MNIRYLSAAAVLLALSAPAIAEDTAGMNMSGMKMNRTDMSGMSMETPQATPAAHAEGTIRAIDAAHGTVTLAHGAVPALQWPPMTMAFKTRAGQLDGLKVGDKVAFDFRTGNGGASIVNIRKQ